MSKLYLFLKLTLKDFFNSYVALDDLHSHHFEAKKEIVFLDMSKNNLESLDDETIGAIYGSSKLRNISFGKNPWKCDCNARKILDFVKVLSGNKIQDYEHIKCFSDGKLVSSIDIDKICSNFIWIVLGSTFAVLGLIVACTMTFFYTYSLEIKCWLYNHNFCLRFVTEEDLDEDKIYDAFISYAHQDEAFVENVLLTALETEPSPYKICIHVRDWIAGESIVEQVNKFLINVKN